MALQVIDVGSNAWAEGLNFGEFFDEPDLVAATLMHLTSGLPFTAGYCLRFHDVPGGDSWFEPYNGNGVAVQDAKPVNIALPSQVDFRRLLSPEHEWPVLAWSHPNGPIKPFPDAVQRCQVRLRNHENRYLGYFKVVQTAEAPLHENFFTNAYWRTKLWLQSEVDRLRRRLSQQHSDFGATKQRIQLLLQQQKSTHALATLATLMTSQHGSRFNRCAVFVPNSKNELQCVYAHGGDNSRAWNSVQKFVAEESLTVQDLHAKFGEVIPRGDPLHSDMVGERVNLNDTSRIAIVWKSGLNAFPDQESYWMRGDIQFGNGYVNPNGYFPRPIAAKFTHADSWMISHRQRKPGSSVFHSHNQQWFLMPWSSPEGSIGIWLFDLACWSQWDEDGDLLPRLAMANDLLKLFSADFRAVNWNFT